MYIGGIAPARTAASASSVEAVSLAKSVGIKMLDNSLDSSEALSAGMIKMMEQSVNPNIGSNFDMSV